MLAIWEKTNIPRVSLFGNVDASGAMLHPPSPEVTAGQVSVEYEARLRQACGGQGSEALTGFMFLARPGKKNGRDDES